VELSRRAQFTGQPEWILAKGISIIANELDIGIQVITESKKIPAQIWVTLGVDQCCPYLHKLNYLIRCTILHDIMAARNFYGPNAAQRFWYGLQYTDYILPVSNTSKDSLLRIAPYSVNKDKFLTYSGFVDFDFWHELALTEPRESLALIIGSPFEYKNVHESCLLGSISEAKTICVGLVDPFVKRMAPENVIFVTPPTDKELCELYWRARKVITLSSCEGFSLPPLEALAAGVPELYLSDIPVHREIYHEVATLIPLFWCLDKYKSDSNRKVISLEQTVQFRSKYDVSKVFDSVDSQIEKLLK
jgi:glycosyltransferase involved in cell wall biosynthesis